MEFETTYQNLKEKSESQYVEDCGNWCYDARDLYDKRTSLKKSNFAVRRFLKYIGEKEFHDKINLEVKLHSLMRANVAEIEIIKFTKSVDKISNSKETVFTGVKAVWYDVPLKTLIKRHYNGDINEFYMLIEAMQGDDVDTGAGKIPKNLALQFIQALRLIVADGSASRQNRGIFKIHHDLQIAPTHVVDILKEFDEYCEPTCVMARSELEYERGNAPKWLISMADKGYTKPVFSEEELTDEEKRVFAKAKGGKVIVMEGGCKCGHNKASHKSVHGWCKWQGCDCNKFKLRINTKKVIEV